MPPMVQRACVEGSTGKEQPVLPQRRVQMAQHQARFDQRGARIGIDVQDAAQVLRAVDHQRAVHRLAALAGAAAARQHGDAFLARDRQRRGDVVDLLRHDHADRFDLIDRRIGGVAAAVGAVEQHLAADFAPQPLRQTGIARRDSGAAHRSTANGYGLAMCTLTPATLLTTRG